MDAEKLVTDAPPPGKEYRTPEMYYKGVLKGARLIAGECSTDVIFLVDSHLLSCALKTFVHMC